MSIHRHQLRGDFRLPRDAFVGRTEESKTLSETLGRSRLVTLVGAPGIGKTRLATEYLVARLKEVPELGCVALSLNASLDGTQILAQLAFHLGYAGSSSASNMESILEELDTCTQWLIVLDHAECLAGDETGLVDALLDAHLGLQIIATSQVRLGIRGESVVEIGALALPDAAHNLMDSPAAQLFLVRASSVRAPLQLEDMSPAERAQTRGILRALDGIPLAIELTAQRLRTESLLAIANDFLEASSEPSSRAGLDHALELSWRRLAPSEQSALSRLAVLGGSFDVRAATAILATPEAAQSLCARLMECSMLVRVEDTDDDGGVVYRWLEPLRRFALERLRESGHEMAARRAAHAWYSSLGRGLSLAPHEQLVTLRPALKRAWREVLTAINERLGDTDAMALEDAAQLAVLLQRVGAGNVDWEVLRDTVARVWCRAKNAPLSRPTWFGIRLSVIVIAAVDGSATFGSQAADELIASVRIGDPPQPALLACGTATELAIIADDPAKATRLALRAREIAGASDDVLVRAFGFYFEGEFAICVGAPNEALKALEEAEHCLGEPHRMIRMHVVLGRGIAQLLAGDDARAEDHFTRCLAETATDSLMRAKAFRMRALIHLRRGDLNAAQTDLNAAQHAAEHIAHAGEMALVCVMRAVYEAQPPGSSFPRGKPASSFPIGKPATSFPIGKPATSLRGGSASPQNRLRVRAHIEAARSILGPTSKSLYMSVLERIAGALLEGRTLGAAPGLRHYELRLADLVARACVARTPFTKVHPQPSLEPALFLSPDGALFRWQALGAQPTTVDLSHRPTLARCLARILHARLEKPSEPVTMTELLEAGWPDEQTVGSSGASRVYMVIATLRRLGLAKVLVTRATGYLLDPAVSIHMIAAP